MRRDRGGNELWDVEGSHSSLGKKIHRPPCKVMTYVILSANVVSKGSGPGCGKSWYIVSKRLLWYSTS